MISLAYPLGCKSSRDEWNRDEKIINSDEAQKRAVPFNFFTTSNNKYIIQQAYEMMVQGYLLSQPLLLN